MWRSGPRRQISREIGRQGGRTIGFPFKLAPRFGGWVGRETAVDSGRQGDGVREDGGSDVEPGTERGSGPVHPH